MKENLTVRAQLQNKNDRKDSKWTWKEIYMNYLTQRLPIEDDFASHKVSFGKSGKFCLSQLEDRVLLEPIMSRDHKYF